MEGIVRDRCPLCGGKIVVSDLYQTSRDFEVRRGGKVSRRYTVTDCGSMEVSVAGCADRCGAYWDADSFYIGADGKFYDQKYHEGGEDHRRAEGKLGPPEVRCRLDQPVLYEEGLTMGMKLDGLANFGKALVALQADIPEIMDKLVVGEGRFARDQARKICTEENIINTGDYRRNFNSSSKAIRIGTAYKIDVFNNLDYAKPLEYGFRGHFVPGHWDGKSFVYQPKDPQGGMFVHSLIPGHYTLERAVNATKRTQNARLQRRFEQELKKRGYMKYFK